MREEGRSGGAWAAMGMRRAAGLPGARGAGEKAGAGGRWAARVCGATRAVRTISGPAAKAPGRIDFRAGRGEAGWVEVIERARRSGVRKRGGWRARYPGGDVWGGTAKMLAALGGVSRAHDDRPLRRFPRLWLWLAPGLQAVPDFPSCEACWRVRPVRRSWRPTCLSWARGFGLESIPAFGVGVRGSMRTVFRALGEQGWWLMEALAGTSGLGGRGRREDARGDGGLIPGCR